MSTTTRARSLSNSTIRSSSASSCLRSSSIACGFFGSAMRRRGYTIGRACCELRESRQIMTVPAGGPTMLKRLRTGTVVLSLLLCLLTAALGVRSYFFGDSVVVNSAKERSLSLMSQPGCMLWTFGWTTREPVQKAGWNWNEFEWGKPPDLPPDSNFTYGPAEPYWPDWVRNGFGMHSEAQTI